MRHIKVLLPALLSCSIIYGQTTVQYKEIDFLKDDGFASPIREKLGSRVGLKITNINKKLVDINQDIKSTSFNETAPSLFDAFSKASLPSTSAGSSGLTEDNKNLLNTAEVTAALLPDTTKQRLQNLDAQYVNVAGAIFSSKASLNSFSTAYRCTKDVLQYQSDLTMLQDVCDKTFSEILSQVADLTQNTFSQEKMGVPQADKLLLTSKDYTKNEGILNRYLAKIIADGQKYYGEVSDAYLQSKQDELTKSLGAIRDQISGFILQLEKIKNRDDHVNKILASLHKEKSDNELGKLLSDEKERYAKIDISKLHGDLESFAGTGKKELFSVYDYFTHSNWEYYVDPQTIDSDLTVLSVNIKPKSDVRCSPPTRSYELRVRAKSGLKIDFSSGLFTNFGGNNFIDQSYRYDSVPGQATQYKIVRNKPKNSIFPSIGALMHFYCRNGKDVHWAGSFGVSTKDLEKINYHLGGSLIFGYAQRFILSAGVTVTKATLIDDKYYEGQIINKQGAPDAIPTASFNRIGFFAAFTYNLSSK